jgi:Alpha/beta hydrolase domain
MQMHLRQLAVMIVSIVFALAQFSFDASAKIVRMERISAASYGNFKSGEFVRWDVRLFGELSPSAEPVPDLDKAARNSRGMVEYATRATVIMPVEGSRGNGALLLDVPNRGRPISLSLFNSPPNVVVPFGSFDQGPGFLQDAGYTVAAVSWELGHGVELPTFKDAEGTTRYIESTAFAIIRDVADFLGSASADSVGTRNPLAGEINRTLALGYSQTGRFLKSFLVRGYNSVEGRRVFSGMHILGAAAGHINLRSVPGPESGAGVIPTFDNPEVRGVNEEPLAISDVVEQVSSLGQIAPRMIFVNTTTDYFSLRASLGRTGGSGTVDKPLPANVRMYDIAGASHALIPGTGQCKLPYAILDWHPVMRSTLVALDRWVSANISPPPNELMPLREAPAEAMALRAPSYLPKAIIQIPIRDEDGNATGGVRLPDMAAPLGTHGGQNPPLSFACSLGSSYVAFAKTKEEREAVSDSRPSLVERYKDRSDYMNRIRAAARDLEQRGFLLTEDSAIILYGAAEVTAMK